MEGSFLLILEKEIRSLDELDQFAAEFLKLFPTGGMFGLAGDLGAGKTTFVRAVLKQILPGLGRTLSPSFTIHQSYRTKPPVDHFDFYRLENLSKETVLEIGYWEACEAAKLRQGFVFVEWPERAAGLDLGLFYLVTIRVTDGSRVFSVLKQ